MLNLFNQAAAPTWDDPIEMLYACHGKVKKFCGQLKMLPDYLAQHGCNDTAKQAITQIAHYFNRAAPLHHQDEEENFFPALCRVYPEAQRVIDELEAQHIDLHESWAKLDAQLQAIINGTRATPDDDLIQQFTETYAQHMPKEEQLFERGKQLISPEQLRDMGALMAARRRV